MPCFIPLNPGWFIGIPLLDYERIPNVLDHYNGIGIPLLDHYNPQYIIHYNHQPTGVLNGFEHCSFGNNGLTHRLTPNWTSFDSGFGLRRTRCLAAGAQKTSCRCHAQHLTAKRNCQVNRIYILGSVWEFGLVFPPTYPTKERMMLGPHARKKHK